MIKLSELKLFHTFVIPSSLISKSVVAANMNRCDFVFFQLYGSMYMFPYRSMRVTDVRVDFHRHHWTVAHFMEYSPGSRSKTRIMYELQTKSKIRDCRLMGFRFLLCLFSTNMAHQMCI